jgi:tetratricopeptide (TPR) repeat protein
MKSLRKPVALLFPLLCLLIACQSDRTATDAELRTLEGLLLRADSFPGRALSLADSAIGIVRDRKLPDTFYYRAWMVKAKALARSGDVISARQLLDSCMGVAEAGREWAYLGRVAVLSTRFADQDNDGNPGSRTDRVGRYRTAIQAFSKAELRMEKANALSQLGFWLHLKSPVWAVDTLKAAMELFLREDGPPGEINSCATRIAIHSYGLGKMAEGRHYAEFVIGRQRPTADSPQAADMIRIVAANLSQAKPDSALYLFALADRLDPGILNPLSYYRTGKLESAILLMNKGQFDRARSALDSCLAFARRENRRPMEVRVLGQLGECAFRQKDRSAAARYFQSAEAVADELGNVQQKALLEQYLLFAEAVGDRRLASRLAGRLGRRSPEPAVRSTPIPGSTAPVQDSGRAQKVRSNPAPSVAPTASGKPRPTDASASPVEGVPVSPSNVSETWMPNALTRLLERYPILQFVLLPGLLVIILAGWLISRHAQRERIRYFESYLRLLTEGRDYRAFVHGGSKASDKPGSGVNRKEWLMYRLETWLLTEKPFAVPSFGPVDCAAYLDVDIHMLDDIIFSSVGVDARTYINHLRTEAAIHQMRDPAARGLSLQSIRTSSGFMNFKEFRSTFRVSTGVAPGRYRAYCRAEMRKASDD